MGAGYLNQVANRFHTNISFDVYGSGQTAEPAFLGGTDQFIVTAFTTSLPAVVAGKSQVAVFNTGTTLTSIFIAPQKYSASRGSNITNFGPPGNTWCQISSSGTSNTAVLLLAGVNHFQVSQLNLTTTGSVAAVLPTIQNGTCSIETSDPNSAVLGTIEGVSYVVIAQEDVPTTVPTAGEQNGTTLMTTSGFATQYPKLTQAIVDAELQAELLIQSNYTNPNAIYTVLPAAMTQSLSLGAFVQTMALFGQFWNPKYNNGTFTMTQLADTVTLAQATHTIQPGTTVNPSQMATNKFVVRAWKDLNRSIPTNPAINGPATIPSTLAKPSLEAAQAYATLTGQALPANSGPAVQMTLVGATTSTSTSS
jgi:hypothetical protein